jgi:peptidoglycan hydrolase-like protein with peptidoglycan-binding domain
MSLQRTTVEKTSSAAPRTTANAPTTSPQPVANPQFNDAESVAFSPRRVLYMQRAVGNAAVQRMLAGSQIQRDPAPAPTAELTEDQVQVAVSYNRSRRFSVEVIKQIQRAVGVNDDGVLGSGTVRAIAAWQASQGLSVDGKVGPATLAKIIPPEEAALPAEAQEAAAAQSEQQASAPAPEQGGMVQSVVSGLGSIWDTVSDGAADIWEGITDFFGGGETAPPAESPSEEAPQPAPQPSELDQLMLKDRLTPEELKRAHELISAVTDAQARGDLYQALQAKVEYHSQRDNQSTSGGKNIGDVMCNLTSLAMALSYLGVPNPDPTKQYEDALEDIRVKNNLPARTTAEGWGGVAEKLGVKAEFIGYDLKKDKDWYMANVLPKLRDGYAVMMSISGHIVRMQDVTEEGLIIDDPYGVVNLQAGEGWSYDKDNKNAREGEGTNRGEDSVWAWSAVTPHNMRWIAALK